MVALMALLFRRFLSRDLVDEARQEANVGRRGSMEGHAEMDMSVTEGSLWQRIVSGSGFTAISHYFVMDWASVWKDIAGGLLLAGALGAWVPQQWWQAFFFTRDPLISAIWGPVIGPLVSVISFVCSIGNVPLAAVLWNGGISFGGVIAFIFADLIVLPILDIYRKYYGGRVALFIAGIFYVSMVLAAWAIEALFGALHLTPAERNAQIVEASVQFNYTTALNILFLLLAAVLVWRFLKTGGPAMLKMMDMAPEQQAHLT
jgi:uncharacterized membrane protein YraQ (UPF0718 family)